MFSYSFSWRHEKVSRVVWTATARGVGEGTRRSHTSNIVPPRLAERVWCTKFHFSTPDYLLPCQWVPVLAPTYLLPRRPIRCSHCPKTWHKTSARYDSSLSRPARSRRHNSIFWTSVPYTRAYFSRDMYVSKSAGFITVSAIFHEILQYWGTASITVEPLDKGHQNRRARRQKGREENDRCREVYSLFQAFRSCGTAQRYLSRIKKQRGGGVGVRARNFFLALFLRAALHYPNPWNRLRG